MGRKKIVCMAFSSLYHVRVARISSYHFPASTTSLVILTVGDVDAVSFLANSTYSEWRAFFPCSSWCIRLDSNSNLKAFA